MLLVVTTSKPINRREATMHPWIAGRIVETMQHDARGRVDQARLVREATRRSSPVLETETREPRRARAGLVVARLGLRMAGRRGEALARTTTVATSNPDPNHWSNPWTTCGATSTSTH